MTRNAPLLFVLTSLLASQAAFGQELIEKVVVRNRLYPTSGRFEAGVNVGLTLQSRLTDNINLNAHAAYNLSNNWALELRGGYGITRHTSLADNIAAAFIADNPATADDFSELWEMTANGVIGFRWAPIYGKISLMAELPVHFQAYLWLGAGGSLLKRESLVSCTPGDPPVCNSENKFSAVGTLALGFRFFATENSSLLLEMRDWSYPDSYREKINRGDATSGTPVASPGIINLVQVDLGYSYLF